MDIELALALKNRSQRELLFRLPYVFSKFPQVTLLKMPWNVILVRYEKLFPFRTGFGAL